MKYSARDDAVNAAVFVGGQAELPGGMVPPHPERRAVYHALEGEGVFHLDGEALPFRAGAVVVAPSGSRRGIEAVTRLAFLAVRIGPPLDAAG